MQHPTPGPGCSSEGVKKSSEGVEVSICGTYPRWTPDEIRAYTKPIR